MGISDAVDQIAFLCWKIFHEIPVVVQCSDAMRFINVFDSCPNRPSEMEDKDGEMLFSIYLPQKKSARGCLDGC